jgi:hypothetical protein
MDSSRPFLVFFGVFAAAFAVIYVFAMELNWAAFTYHPRLVEFDIGAKPPRSGPAMYWYGWMTTSALGGLAAGGAAVAMLSRTVPAKLWFALGWLVPAGAMLVSIYFMMPFFTR